MDSASERDGLVQDGSVRSCARVCVLLFALSASAEPNATKQGPTLIRIDPPSGAGASSPSLSTSGGKLLLSWLEPAAGAGDAGQPNFRLRLARFDGERWGSPMTVTESNRIAVNWANLPSAVEADDGAVVAQWSERNAGGPYATDVRVAKSTHGAAENCFLGLKPHPQPCES